MKSFKKYLTLTKEDRKQNKIKHRVTRKQMNDRPQTNHIDNYIKCKWSKKPSIKRQRLSCWKNTKSRFNYILSIRNGL